MRLTLCLALLALSVPSTADAYIDPGSGSAIMSAIIGFFVVIGLTIKSFWYKIKTFFTGGSKDETSTEADE